MWCYSDSGGFSAVCSFSAASALMVVVFMILSEMSGSVELAHKSYSLWGIPLRFF